MARPQIRYNTGSGRATPAGFVARTVNHGDDIKADPTLVGYQAAGVTSGMLTSTSSFTITTSGTYSLFSTTKVTVATDVTGVIIEKFAIDNFDAHGGAIQINGRTNPDNNLPGDVIIRYGRMDCHGTGEIVVNGDSGGYTLLRCEMTGAGDGIRANDMVTMDECYIHGLGNVYPDPHSDGVQRFNGRARNLTFRRNFILNDDPVGPVSCIMIGGEGPAGEGPITIDDNAFSGGSYCLYYDAPPASGIVRRNHWHRDLYSSGGSLGPANTAQSPLVQSGNVFVPDLTPISL